MPKRYVHCIIIVACLASWVDSQTVFGQDPAVAGSVGRWQIFRADLAATPNMAGKQPLSAFSSILIDTVTGDTWILWPSDSGGKQTYTWTPIDRAKPNAAAVAFPPVPLGRPAAVPAK